MMSMVEGGDIAQGCFVGGFTRVMYLPPRDSISAIRGAELWARPEYSTDAHDINLR